MRLSLVFLVLSAHLCGCFGSYGLYTIPDRGYCFWYGEDKWKITPDRIGKGLPFDKAEELEKEGIYSIHVLLPVPRPSDGKPLLAAVLAPARKRQDLIVAFRLTEKGEEKVAEWRKTKRSKGLLLLTEDVEMRMFETAPIGSRDPMPHNAHDIRALFEPGDIKEMPAYVQLVAYKVEGTLRLDRARPRKTCPEEEFTDMLGYDGTDNKFSMREQLPIDLVATADFVSRDGKVSTRKVVIRFSERFHTHYGRIVE